MLISNKMPFFLFQTLKDTQENEGLETEEKKAEEQPGAKENDESEKVSFYLNRTAVFCTTAIKMC